MNDRQSSQNHPLYNSTFSLYRVSPLYHGETKLLNPTTLRIHACRLRDVLKGDTLRGVHVGTEPIDADLNVTGRLEDCTWDLLDEDTLWSDSRSAPISQQQPGRQHRPVNRRLVPADDCFGIQIQLHYERATQSALLLRNIESTASVSATKDPLDGFTSFPLLLIRIPQPTRQTVISHLSRTFDAHIAPLQLSDAFLCQSLERFLDNVSPSDGDADRAPATVTPSLLKALNIQLSLPTVSPLLKTIDVSIASDDVLRMLQTGRQTTTPSSPFTSALSKYLTTHLALAGPPIPTPTTSATHTPAASYLRPASFHINKLACASLALSRDGKLKLIPPPPPQTQGRGAIARQGLEAAGEAHDACMHALRELLETTIEKADVGAQSGEAERGNGKGIVGLDGALETRNGDDDVARKRQRNGQGPRRAVEA